jgi:hypothetical protein
MSDEVSQSDKADGKRREADIQHNSLDVGGRRFSYVRTKVHMAVDRVSM